MLAGVSTRSLPTEPPIVKLQYSSAGVEVTNCVRRTCCYEYYIRLMQSGSVIPVSCTRRRAQARQRQSCPWASLSRSLFSPSLSVHYLYSLPLSCSLAPFLSLSMVLALFFPAHQGGRGACLCCFCSLPPQSLQASAITKTRWLTL